MKAFFRSFWLPLAAGLLIVGIDQTLRHPVWQEGLLSSYPFFMLASVFLLLHKFSKKKEIPQSERKTESGRSASSKRPKKTKGNPR